MHQVILLNNLATGKIPDLSRHFQVSYQDNPSMDIFQWLNKHFSPVSKHLFDDPAHHQEKISSKCSSLFFVNRIRVSYVYFISIGRKIHKLASKGIYNYLYADEILNPPKG